MAPEILGCGRRSDVIQKIIDFYRGQVEEGCKPNDIETAGSEEIRAVRRSIDMLRTQFVALGLMSIVSEPSGIAGRRESWIATEEGFRYFGRQGAVKR
jgi:hypothetical protein